MITKKELLKLCAEKDIEASKISDEDLAYVMLKKFFGNAQAAYFIAYCKDAATESEIKNNDKKPVIRTIEQCLIEKETPLTPLVTADSISFEENRDALIGYLTEIDREVANGTIEPKDGYKLKMDIRNKLNEKFNVKEQTVEQRVVVQPKFNYICRYTHKECYLMTKEYAMETFNLIEKPKR